MPSVDIFVRGSVVLSFLACAACSTNATSGDQEENVDVAEHGVASANPFEATYCDGAPINRWEVAAHFAAGATHAELGRFEVEARKRSCNSFSGCAAWQRATELLYTVQHARDYSSSYETWRLPATHDGTIAVDVVRGEPQLTLTSDPITYDEDQYGPRSGVLAFSTTSFVGRTFDGPYATLKMCDEGGPTCNHAAHPGGGYLNFVEEQSGILTKDCLRRLVPFRADAVADGSEWTEYEYVWYGRF